MAILILLVACLALVAVGLVAIVGLRRQASVPPAASPAIQVERLAVVVLDLDHADPTHSAVQRLVHEAATRTFASRPDAQEVEVRGRDGGVLGRAARVAATPHQIWLPEFLHEPHARRHPGPDLSGHFAEEEPFLPSGQEGPAESLTPIPRWKPLRERSRPLVDCLDLAPGIRSRVRKPDDPVDVVRSILEAAGLEVVVTDDLLRVDDLAIVVVRNVGGGSHDTLNRAYLQIAASGLERGLVITFDHVPLDEVRSRELLDPHVLHTGFAGVQRMADAVALRADPIRFAVGAPLAPAPASP